MWYGDNTWAIPIWTLSLELIATFMVYLIAQTVIEYKYRGWIYGLVISFFLILFLPLVHVLLQYSIQFSLAGKGLATIDVT